MDKSDATKLPKSKPLASVKVCRVCSLEKPLEDFDMQLKRLTSIRNKRITEKLVRRAKCSTCRRAINLEKTREYRKLKREREISGAPKELFIPTQFPPRSDTLKAKETWSSSSPSGPCPASPETYW